MNHSIDDILTWLDEVKDPEIPVLSLPDLGVIKAVTFEEEKILVTLTPTFVGCPALDFMKTEILQVLERHGIRDAEVIVSFKEPWSSDQISPRGKAALKAFGLAPPPAVIMAEDLSILEYAICPRCGGQNTEMRSPFGPTLCRSIHYCNDCREAFEQFKPL